MDKFIKCFGLTAGILAAGLVSSCSSDIESDIKDSNIGIPKSGVLVKAPEVSAWSGSEVFGGSTKTRAIEVDAIEPVTTSEIAAAKAYFNYVDGLSGKAAGTALGELPAWKNYYVQLVVKGNPLPSDWAMMMGDTNKEEVSNVSVWNIDPDDVIKVLNTEAYAEHEARVAINFDEAQLVSGHTLKDLSFETVGYDSWNTKYEMRTSGHSYQYSWAPNYRIVSIDDEDVIYVALYGYTTGNNGFWDTIIKISKVDLPEAPEVDEPAGDSFNDIAYAHKNEVEVNLSVIDTHEAYDVEDLATKLSIHVRHPKDITVRIPVPVENLVPADDLAIVLAHSELLESYGKDNVATFEINGNTVELHVDFTEAQDCAGNGYGYYIEVSTKGINKDVIEYCFKNNGDGINFEVFNYYQWNVTSGEETKRVKPTSEQIDQLIFDWFDLTTVEIGYSDGTNWHIYTNMVDLPYYFINAITDSDNAPAGSDNPNMKDCHVRLNSNQGGFYENLYEGLHLNGATHNVIYVRNDIWGTELQDNAHTAPRY